MHTTCDMQIKVDKTLIEISHQINESTVCMTMTTTAVRGWPDHSKSLGSGPACK